MSGPIVSVLASVLFASLLEKTGSVPSKTNVPLPVIERSTLPSMNTASGVESPGAPRTIVPLKTRSPSMPNDVPVSSNAMSQLIVPG